MSLRTSDQGSVMWTPLAGRIESGWIPSSSARTSSAHTPVALTTDLVAMLEPLTVGFDDRAAHTVDRRPSP